MFKTILLPSDFSGCSAEAARAARLLTECFGSRLIVLHVLDEPAALDPMFRGEVPLELLRGRMEQYAREGMGAFLKAHFEGLREWRPGRPPAFPTGRSSAKPGSAGRADRHRDARPHRGGARDLRSTAEKVVRMAPCPVLSVREGGKEFVHP